jgi:hypothetical protein
MNMKEFNVFIAGVLCGGIGVAVWSIILAWLFL